MQKNTRIIMLIMVVAMLLTACSPAAQEAATPKAPAAEAPASEASGEAPAASSGRIGGQLVYGYLTEPNLLNPIIGVSQPDREVPTTFVLEGLMYINPETNAAEPWLATSVDISDDELEFTFKLREDVTWHDGEAFTAEDVKFTFDAILDPETHSTVYGDFQAIQEVSIIDDYTVKFVLKKINAPFLSMMTFPIVPEHILAGQNMAEAAFNTAPIGTGSFKFESWQAGDQMSFVANENYYLGMPQLDRVVLRVIKDQSALVAALMAGDLDMTTLTADVISMIDSTDGLKTIQADPSWTIDLWMNGKVAPLNDKAARKAIAYAVDREKFVETICEGQGYVPYSYLPPSSWAYNPDVSPKYTYDPEQAKRLLEEAGYILGIDGIYEKDGVKLSIEMTWPTGDSVREACGQYIQSELSKIGVEVVLRSMDTPSWVATWEGNFTSCLVGVSRTYDPEFSKMFQQGGAWNNYIGYYNEEAERIQNEALSTTDRETRKALYYKLQDLLAEDLPVFQVYNPYKALGAKEGLNLGDPIFVGQRNNRVIGTSGWTLMPHEWCWTE